MSRGRSRRTIIALLAFACLVALGGCGGFGATIGPSPGPTSGPMAEGELRLFLGGRLGPPWFCDPDSFPVGRDEQASAIERYPEMVADAGLFAAGLEALGIDPGDDHTDAQKLAIYRLWKAARAITLEPVGDGRYRFDYLVQPGAGQAEGRHVTGTIDDQGRITDAQEEAADEPNCPICLAAGTPIETPTSAIPVDRLRLGDPIWTLDAAGRRVIGTVIALGSTVVPPDHPVVRLVLVDGRAVTASPGHPLADGRSLGELKAGDVVDGSRVVHAELISYAGASTFDLVASGETGAYFAGGIPLGSTLRR